MLHVLPIGILAALNGRKTRNCKQFRVIFKQMNRMKIRSQNEGNYERRFLYKLLM